MAAVHATTADQEPAPALLTVEQAAAMLNVHGATVRRMAEDGSLAVVAIRRPGKDRGAVRIVRESVVQFIQHQTKPASSP
jgi:excisionase family DNA binding protein